jgi:signal transduction histidine kinase
VPKSWPAAKGYAPWVAEVWLNLVSNALKYGGAPPLVELGAAAEGEQVRFWVRDNGQPLSDEERVRIFTPFTRLHRERAAGHGLGLATVQRIVARLGGRVDARPAPNGGNEFCFWLPALASRTAKTAVQQRH